MDEQRWVFEKGLGMLMGALSSNRVTEGPFLMSDRVTFADLQIASAFLWTKLVGEHI